MSQDKYIISAAQLATLSLVASNLEHFRLVADLSPQLDSGLGNLIEALSTIHRFIKSSPLPTLTETLAERTQNA